MPSVRWCLLVGVAALAASAPLSAQTAPVAKMQATITLANSETRSGPGLGMAMTGRMNAGATIQGRNGRFGCRLPGDATAALYAGLG